jgi:hypothetical protein
MLASIRIGNQVDERLEGNELGRYGIRGRCNSSEEDEAYRNRGEKPRRI